MGLHTKPVSKRRLTGRKAPYIRAGQAIGAVKKLPNKQYKRCGGTRQGFIFICN